jgi:hypothetical protein
MTHASAPVPYVPGPSSAPPSSPTAARAAPSRSRDWDGPAQYQPAAVTAAPSAGPVVVGEPVDLAHELGALRKLQMTTMSLAGLALLFAFFATIFSGFVAYELWRFLGALDKAFG